MNPEGQNARVASVNLSTEKGTIKTPAEEIEVDERGVVGDAHRGAWHRQVSLLAEERIRHFSEQVGRQVAAGEFAENITTAGIDLRGVGLLDRFRIGETVLEVTQIGKECHGDSCAIFREVGKCVMPTEGIFCRVRQGGRIRPGMGVEYERRPLRCRVLTVSDRVAAGDYEDRSGPRVAQLLEEYFQGRPWHPDVSCGVVPDEAPRIRSALEELLDEGVDVIVTSGGTGIGPRDVTPEVVREVMDREVPGIMEHVRLKYGAEAPNALLSRSVAGVTDRALIYALPGSPRAVNEYMAEIEKTLEHALLMLHGIGH